MTISLRENMAAEDFRTQRPDVYVVSVDSTERDVGEVAEQFQMVLDLEPRERPHYVGLLFAGYDEDPREIDEIPEIKFWCRRFLDGPTASTLVALSDERQTVPCPSLREVLLGMVGLIRFIALAGYGQRVDDRIGLTTEGFMILSCLTGEVEAKS